MAVYLIERKLNEEYILSTEEKEKITNGILNHSSYDNDRADKFYRQNISKEQHIIDNYDSHIRVGKIKSEEDEWWQDHKSTLDSLKAQYQFFKSERERLGK